MDRPPDAPRRAFDIFYDADLATEEKLRDLKQVLEYWEGDENDDPYSG